MSNRNAKVSELLMREISAILHTQFQGESVAITITAVDVSPDHRQAKVFYSLVLEGHERAKAERFLKNVTPRVRRELSQRIVLRQMPALRFVYDESVARGAYMDQLIDSLEYSDENDPEPKTDQE